MALSENPEAVVQISLTLPVDRLRELADEAESAASSYSHGGTTDAEIDLAELVLSPLAAALYTAVREHGC